MFRTCMEVFMDRTSAEPDGNTAPKRIYAEPKLTEYGSVAKLTESHAISTVSDVGSNAMHP
jgi:hypothetical protein